MNLTSKHFINRSLPKIDLNLAAEAETPSPSRLTP